MGETIYEGFLTDYLAYTDNFYKKVVAQVISRITNRHGGQIKILELGCGSGAFSRFFLAHNASVTLHGIDVSESLISIAKSVTQCYGGRARFYTIAISPGFFGSIPIDLGQYDAIFCGAFLHHLSKIERKALLHHLERMMKPDSVFACFEPNAKNPAIFFQYIFETRLNPAQYDRREFPINPNEFEIPRVELLYLDAEYRGKSATETVQRKPMIRYGLLGKAIWTLCYLVFSVLYSRCKKLDSDSNSKDYFMFIAKFVR